MKLWWLGRVSEPQLRYAATAEHPLSDVRALTAACKPAPAHVQYSQGWSSPQKRRPQHLPMTTTTTTVLLAAAQQRAAEQAARKRLSATVVHWKAKQECPGEKASKDRGPCEGRASASRMTFLESQTSAVGLRKFFPILCIRLGKNAPNHVATGDVCSWPAQDLFRCCAFSWIKNLKKHQSCRSMRHLQLACARFVPLFSHSVG